MTSFELQRDAHLLLAKLRRDAILLVHSELGVHVQGLSISGKQLGLSSAWRRRLREWDSALGLVEKISPQTIRKHLDGLKLELGRVKMEHSASNFCQNTHADVRSISLPVNQSDCEAASRIVSECPCHDLLEQPGHCVHFDISEKDDSNILEKPPFFEFECNSVLYSSSISTDAESTTQRFGPLKSEKSARRDFVKKWFKYFNDRGEQRESIPRMDISPRDTMRETCWKNCPSDSDTGTFSLSYPEHVYERGPLSTPGEDILCVSQCQSTSEDNLAVSAPCVDPPGPKNAEKQLSGWKGRKRSLSSRRKLKSEGPFIKEQLDQLARNVRNRTLEIDCSWRQDVLLQELGPIGVCSLAADILPENRDWTLILNDWKAHAVELVKSIIVLMDVIRPALSLTALESVDRTVAPNSTQDAMLQVSDEQLMAQLAQRLGIDGTESGEKTTLKHWLDELEHCRTHIHRLSGSAHAALELELLREPEHTESVVQIQPSIAEGSDDDELSLESIAAIRHFPESLSRGTPREWIEINQLVKDTTRTLAYIRHHAGQDPVHALIHRIMEATPLNRATLRDGVSMILVRWRWLSTISVMLDDCGEIFTQSALIEGWQQEIHQRLATNHRLVEAHVRQHRHYRTLSMTRRLAIEALLDLMDKVEDYYDLPDDLYWEIF